MRSRLCNTWNKYPIQVWSGLRRCGEREPSLPFFRFVPVVHESMLLLWLYALDKTLFQSWFRLRLSSCSAPCSATEKYLKNKVYVILQIPPGTSKSDSGQRLLSIQLRKMLKGDVMYNFPSSPFNTEDILFNITLCTMRYVRFSAGISEIQALWTGWLSVEFVYMDT